MKTLFRWFFGRLRGFRVVARGKLPGTRSRWIAVPSRQARFFKDAHPAADNASSFAHIIEWIQNRYPQDAAKARAILAAVRALEKRHSTCVIFVLKG